MKVADLIAIKDSKVNNREKGLLIARMMKATSKRNNPQDGETPSGWNAAPYPGGQTDKTGA